MENNFFLFTYPINFVLESIESKTITSAIKTFCRNLPGRFSTMSITSIMSIKSAIITFFNYVNYANYVSNQNFLVQNSSWYVDLSIF